MGYTSLLDGPKRVELRAFVVASVPTRQLALNEVVTVGADVGDSRQRQLCKVCGRRNTAAAYLSPIDRAGRRRRNGLAAQVRAAVVVATKRHTRELRRVHPGDDFAVRGT